ncbi:hypothetical protein EIM92_15225 [Paenibacillus lentus]|uniref:Transposase n=1 Tax=Paenibacillus lentus TaxID=1338368 RepID=A0A3Q8SER4_9BACL|nr:hypothetical protein EIM92_15225 [Paenibacillus lentus]
MAGIEDQIIALYAKGVCTREIQEHLKKMTDDRCREADLQSSKQPQRKELFL